MICFECKNVIAYEELKDAVKRPVIERQPVFDGGDHSFIDFAVKHREICLHKNCAQGSERAQEIRKLIKNNAVFSMMLELAEQESLTWKETLEIITAQLLRENERMREILNKPFTPTGYYNPARIKE